jgi:UDP-glucuronate 4-epimerase
MNILITGAAGFIGFHVAKFLKGKNNFVIGLDNFNSYYDVNLKKKRSQILKENDIDVINSDINQKEKLLQILKDYNITHIIHLAAQAGVRYSLINPQSYIDSNLSGFINVLEACREKPNIKLIFASSSSVYGLNKKTPFSINDVTDNPTSLYGATKKANELIAHSYHHLFKIPMIGLRFFTVYGPWGRPDMAYFSFTKNILENKPIDIFNHGNMKRDFTYIDDIVSGIANSLEHKCDFEIFNLGNNNPVNILDFISILEKHLNKKALKNLLPMRKEEVFQTFADIEKSKKHLLFSPKYDLEKGLEKFVSWYKNYY